MNIHIINGPNLNLLGKREPQIYGSLTFEEYLQQLQQQFEGHNLQYYQSNHEGVLIDKLHDWGFSSDGIILNAGGYTHTSVALADAVSAIKTPVVEVHISRVHARESFRHHSYLSPVCAGTITGLGLSGYALALQYLLDYHTR